MAALFRGAIVRDSGQPYLAEGEIGKQSKRPLSEEDIVRLILEGTVVGVRLDKKARSISLLIVLGVRRNSQWCCSP